jgi:hypothetical protein
MGRIQYKPPRSSAGGYEEPTRSGCRAGLTSFPLSLIERGGNAGPPRISGSFDVLCRKNANLEKACLVRPVRCYARLPVANQHPAKHINTQNAGQLMRGRG